MDEKLERELKVVFSVLQKKRGYTNIDDMKTDIVNKGIKSLYGDLPESMYKSEEDFASRHDGWKGITATEKKKDVSVSEDGTSVTSKKEATIDEQEAAKSYKELYGSDISLEGMEEPLSEEEKRSQESYEKQERIKQGIELSDDEIRENKAKAEKEEWLSKGVQDYDPDTFFDPTSEQMAQPTQEEVLSEPVAKIEEDIEGTIYKEDFEEREVETEKARFQEGIESIKDIPDWSFRESEEFKAAIENINADLFQAYNDAPLENRRDEKLNLIEDLEEEYGKYGFVFTKDASNIYVRTQDGKKTLKIPTVSSTLVDAIPNHEEIKWFIKGNASPVEDVKNEDYITKAFNVQKSRSVKPEDTDGASMVAILDSFTDESIAFPTMFPKDPGNVTKDPNDWILFGPDELDAAQKMAEERGEIYKFDNIEDAEEFVDGGWKDVSPVDIEGDLFFKEKDLNYMILMKADARYQEAYDEIKVIEDALYGGKYGGEPTEKEIKKYPWLYLKDGRVRTDVEDRLEKLKEEVIQLREVVEADPKGREAIRNFNLYLQKESNKKAQVAAKHNEQAKLAEQYANDVFSEELSKYGITKPLNEISQKELTSILTKNPSLLPEFEQFVADRLVAEKNSDIAATNYYLASTFFDRKTRKHITTDFVDDWEAVKAQWKDGYANGNAAALILAISLGIKDIDKVTAKEISEHLLSMNKVQGRAFSRYVNSRSAADSWDAFKSDPFEITFGLVANSLAQIIPIGATLVANPSTGIGIIGTGAAGGFALGGPAGALRGAITSVQGASAFALEYTNSILEAARDEGYQIEDPEQMFKALNDTEVWRKGRDIGSKRGITIGAFNMVSAGFAGNIIKTSKFASRGKKATAFLTERLVVDSALEGGGELAAQVVAGQEVDFFEGILEAQGGIGSSAPTAVVSVLANSGKKVNVLTAIEMTRRDFVAKENASFKEISDFATRLHSMGQIDDSVNDAIQENLVLRQEAETLLGLSKKKKSKHVLNRTMDLLKAQKTLSKDENSKKIYKDELAKIDSELSNLVKGIPTKQLVDLDDITDVTTGEAISMQPQVTSYKINGKRYTKKDFKNKFDKMSDKKRRQSTFEVNNDDEFGNELAEKFQNMDRQEEAPEVSTAETVSDRGIAEEFEDIPDDETQTFPAESLDKIPEQYRDRAKKSTSKEVKSRKTIFGIPIGRKETVIKEEFTYSVTGKEIKETIAKERTTEEAAPVQADTEVAEKQEKAAEVATTETTSDRGISEDFKDIPDDETRTFPAENLEDIPEQYRDRAKKSTSKEVKSRRTVFGIPIGRKKTVIKEEFTYTLTGKEIKEQQAAQEERTTEEAAPMGAETEVAEVAPMAEVFYESEESIPKELKEAKSTTIKEVKKDRYRVRYNEDEVFIEAPAVTEEFESMDAVPQAIQDASSTVITETDKGKVSVTYKQAEVLGVTLEGKKKEAPVQEEADIEAEKAEIEERRKEEIDKKRNRERRPLDKGLERIENLEKEYSEAKTKKEKESVAIKLLNEISRFRKNATTGQGTDTEINRINELEKSIKDNHGLEIVSLKGKKYDVRNKTEVANFENGKSEGKVSIYSREVRPQINKNGVLVQEGEYDVLKNVTKEEADNAIKPKQSKLLEINAKYDAEVAALEKSKKKPPRKRLRLADEKKADTKKKEAAITEEMKAMDQAEKDFVVPRGKSERQDVNPVKESRSEAKLTDKEAEKMGFDSVDDMSRPIEYYEGIPMGILMSDHLASGTHKDAAGKPMKVKGGILFNTLGSIKNRALAWAGIDRNGAAKQYKEALSIYKANKPLFERLWAEGKIPYGHIPFAVAKMADSAINSNEAVFRWLSPRVKELEAKYPKRAKSAFKAFVDSISKLQGLTPKQRETLQETKAKLEQDPNNQKLQEKLDNLEEKQSKQIILNFIKKNKITTMSQLLDAVVEDAAKRAKNPADADLSLPPRAFLFKHVFSTPSKAQDISKVGPSKNWSRELLRDSKDKNKDNQVFIPNSKEGVYNQLTEPSMREGRQGDIVAVMGVKVVDKDGKQAGGVKETDHENYGFGPEGKLISFVSNPRHGTDVFAEWEVKASRVFKVDKAGKKPSREGLRTQIGGTFFIDGAFRGMKVSAKERGIAAMLIAKMRHAFPTVGITASKSEFDAMMEREDVRTREVDGMVIYGITLDGNIYLNPEAIDIATPIHEFGHVWIDYLRNKALQAPKGKEAKLLAKGMALAKADKSYQSFVDKYGDKNLAAEELLVELIATKGETIVNAAQKAKFKEWFNAFFKYIKEKFTKSKDIKSSKIKDLTLDEFANIGLADLFGGQLIDGKFDPSEVVDSFKARLSIKESDGTKLTMDQIITQGRQEGFPDNAIKTYLKTQGYKVADINKAMAISIDLNTPMPTAFTTILGGSKAGINMFNEIKKGLDNWAKGRWGKGKSFTEYRMKAMELLMDHETFKKQSKKNQDKLIVAMDVVIGSTPKRDVNAPINSIIDTVKLIKNNKWKGDVSGAKKSLSTVTAALAGTKIHSKKVKKIKAIIGEIKDNGKNFEKSVDAIEKILNEIIKDNTEINTQLNNDIKALNDKIIAYGKKTRPTTQKEINEIIDLVELLDPNKVPLPQKTLIKKMIKAVKGIKPKNADKKFVDLSLIISELIATNATQKERTTNLKNTIETLKEKIRIQKVQASGLRNIKLKVAQNIREATRALRDLGVKNYTYAQVQKLVYIINSADEKNILEKMKKVSNILLAAEKTQHKKKLGQINKMIKEHKKTAKNRAGATKMKKPIGATGQQWFDVAQDFNNYARDYIKGEEVNKNNMIEALQIRSDLKATYTKEQYEENLELFKNDPAKKPIYDIIVKIDKLLENEDTNPTLSSIPDLLLGMETMSLEELNALEIDLKTVKLAFAKQLANKRAIEKEIIDKEKAKGKEQIQKDFPMLYDEEVVDVDGEQTTQKVLKEKSDNQSEINERARRKVDVELIKELIKNFKNLIKNRFKTSRVIVGIMGNTRLICESLDNIPNGRTFFTDNVDRAIRSMESNALRGKQTQMEKMEDLAESIDPDYAYNKPKTKKGSSVKKDLAAIEKQRLPYKKTGKVYKSRDDISDTIKNDRTKTIVKVEDGYQVFKNGLFNGEEMIRLYSLSKNENVRKVLENQGIDDKQLQLIKDVLGPKLVAFADKTVDYLTNPYFTPLNDVYSEVNHVNLKKEDNYFPVIRDVGPSVSDIQINLEGDFKAAFNQQYQSFVIERVNSKNIIDFHHNFTTVLENHFDGVEKYKAFAVGVKKMSRLLNTPDVVALLNATGLKDLLYKFINNTINPITFKNNAWNKFWNFAMTQYVSSAIGMKSVQLRRQAVSSIASLPFYEHEKTKNIPDGIARTAANLPYYINDHKDMVIDIMKHPIEFFRKVRKVSPYFQERVDRFFRGAGFASLETNLTQEEAKNIRRKLWYKFQQLQGSFTFAGDIAGVLGYWPVYERHLKNGMDPELAAEKFEDYNKTQQSGSSADLNQFQLMAKKMPMLAAITAFKTTQFLYQVMQIAEAGNMMKVIEAGKNKPKAIVKALTGPHAVRFMWATTVLPVGYTISRFWSKYWEGDDEDKEEVMYELKKSAFGLDMLLAIPLLNQAVGFLEAEYSGKRPSQQLNPALEMGRSAYYWHKSFEPDKKSPTLFNMFADKKENKNHLEKVIKSFLGANTRPLVSGFNYFFNSSSYKNIIEEEKDYYRMVGEAESTMPTLEVKTARERVKERSKKRSERRKK